MSSDIWVWGHVLIWLRSCRGIEGDGSQCPLMSSNSADCFQGVSIVKHNFACGQASGIGHVRIGMVDREGTQTCWICRNIQDGLQQLHVFNVVNVNGLLQTHQQPLPVQPYGQDVAGVAVITDLCAFLEMIDVHLAWLRVTDHHHQAAGEEALHDVDIRDFITSVDLVQLLHRTQRKQLITGFGSNC